MLHSKRLQASWGQAPSPPARALCARSLRSLAGSHAACATRCRSPAALCWLAGKGFRSRRRVPAPRLRFVWLSLLICLLAPPAACGGRANRGGPRPANGLSALARLTACTRSSAPAGRSPLRGRIGRDAPAGSTTFRPKVCDAPAGAFRPCGALAVQSP